MDTIRHSVSTVADAISQLNIPSSIRSLSPSVTSRRGFSPTPSERPISRLGEDDRIERSENTTSAFLSLQSYAHTAPTAIRYLPYDNSPSHAPEILHDHKSVGVTLPVAQDLNDDVKLLNERFCTDHRQAYVNRSIETRFANPLSAPEVGKYMDGLSTGIHALIEQRRGSIIQFKRTDTQITAKCILGYVRRGNSSYKVLANVKAGVLDQAAMLLPEEKHKLKGTCSQIMLTLDPVPTHRAIILQKKMSIDQRAFVRP
jgi:hypothetical protein